MAGPAVSVPEPIGGLFWPPGNPESCTDAGSSMRGMADACGQITSWTTSAHPAWEGEAGTAYVYEAAKVGQDYSAAATALTAGSAALQVYGQELAELQRRARTLQAEAEEFERARERLIEEIGVVVATGLPPTAPVWQELERSASRLDEQRTEIVGRNSRIKHDTDQSEQDAARALNKTGGLTPAARQLRTDPPPAPPSSSGGDHWWDNIDPEALLDVLKDTGWTALGTLGMGAGVVGLLGDGAGEAFSLGFGTPVAVPVGAGLVGLIGASGMLTEQSLQKLIKDAGRLYSDDGSAPTTEPPTSGANGPGEWKPAGEGKGRDAPREYQERVTGHSYEWAYKVPGPDGKLVKFDGFDDDQNALIDAKGAQYDHLLRIKKVGQSVADELIGQARRQTQAAGSTRIIWYVKEEGAANQMARLLAKEGYNNIDVEWRP